MFLIKKSAAARKPHKGSMKKSTTYSTIKIECTGEVYV
jgi:hypothetical protein